MAATVPIICFNDVYRVSQRYVPQPGAPKDTGKAAVEDGHISVSQFGKLLLSERDKWDNSPSGSTSGYTDTPSSSVDNGAPDGEGSPRQGEAAKDKLKEGLVLFAGDLFNPSVESAVTRGSHMVSCARFNFWMGSKLKGAGAHHQQLEGRLCLRWQPRFRLWLSTSHQTHQFHYFPLATIEHRRQDHWESPRAITPFLGD